MCACVTCMSLSPNQCVSVWEDKAVRVCLNVLLCSGMC